MGDPIICLRAAAAAISGAKERGKLDDEEAQCRLRALQDDTRARLAAIGALWTVEALEIA